MLDQQKYEENMIGRIYWYLKLLLQQIEKTLRTYVFVLTARELKGKREQKFQILLGAL